jgi:peptide/nickel transport system ATP-binding protein
VSAAFTSSAASPVTSPLLEVEQLVVTIFRHGRPVRNVVEDVSFDVAAGAMLALVGESGSGKTMIGRSILSLLPGAASVTNGDIRLSGRSLNGLTPAQLRKVRGGEVGMVFQEPMVSLNPALRIGVQMMETLQLHRSIGRSEARLKCLNMLARVGIRDAKGSFDAYPTQFSGGMLQRIMLASVLTTRPRLLIADEPTTALDAISRKQVMDLMLELTQEIGTAVLLISHDLGMVSQYANKVLMLRHGRIVEYGTPDAILLNPKHEYTRALVGALPSRPPRDSSMSETKSESLLQVDDLCIEYSSRPRLFRKRSAAHQAVSGVSMDIQRGETLAVVGESGSGKTTVGRALVRLLDTTAGRIVFDGEDCATFTPQRLAAFRRRTQMVFQDPYSSLDPHMRLGDIVAEGLRMQRLSRTDRIERAAKMLAEVSLPGDYIERFAHELSGGQRQRVCIARAIVGEPSFIVADEPVSALDVTVQHQVTSLLARLQAKYGFTILFISHDLGIVEQIANRVMVMYRGRVVELGSRDDIYDRPCHPYTHRLLAATPRMARRAQGGYELITPDLRPVEPPAGRFWFDAASTPAAQAQMVQVERGHWVCCTC